MSIYAEDFNHHPATEYSSGYSGFSSTLTAAFTPVFPSHISGQLTLEFSASADVQTLRAKEAWVGTIKTIEETDWAFKLGTQAGYDRRGWFYDSTLDMIYARFVSGERWSGQFGTGRETLYYPFESATDYPLHWFAEINYRWSDENFFSLIHHGTRDDDFSGDDIASSFRWLGAQMGGILWSDPLSSIHYWAQSGLVTGTETTQSFMANGTPLETATKQRGWAYDVGITLITSLPGKPEFTLAFANSSSDADMSDDTITHYRQSGSQSNTADTGSASGLAYYGNAFAPSLSNLKVLSTGVTFPILTSSFISLFVRDYRQINAVTYLNEPGVELELTGTSRAVGQAVDVDVSIWESDDWYISFNWGYFFAGCAVTQASSDLSYGLLEINRQL